MDSDVIELEAFQVEESPFVFGVPESLPAKVTTLTGEDLSRASTTTLLDALQTSAGVHVRSWTGGPGQAEVSLRGFGENSGLRVLVLVDGQRLNRPDLRSVNWLQVPLALIERVEVLRGPSTTLYGNHAVGGVINIITKRGDQEPALTLGATRGSYEYYDADAGASGGVGPLSGFATVQHQEAEGYRQNSAYHATTFFGSATYKVFRSWQTRLVLVAQDSAMQFPGSLSFPEYLEDPRSSTVADTIADNPDSLSSYHFAETTILDLLSQNRMDGFLGGEILLDVGIRTRETDNRLGGNFVDDQADAFLARLHWSFEFGRWSGTVGAEYTYDDLDLTRIGSRSSRPIAWAYLDRAIGSGFIYVSRKTGDAFSFSGGVRVEETQLDYEQLVYFNPFLPSDDDPFNLYEVASRTRTGWSAELGGRWRPSPAWEIYVRADRFYRYPVTDEIAAYQGFNLTLGFNSGLEPEEGYALETGISWRTDDSQLGLTFFGKTMDGEIYFDQRQFLNVNMPETTRWGAELNGRHAIGPVEAGFFYTYQEATISESDPFLVATDELDFFGREILAEVVADGQTVPLVPRHKLSSHIELHWPEPLTTRLTVIYTGEQFAGNDWFNNVRVPSYTLVNFDVRWDLAEGVQLFGAIENLLDEEYAGVYFATGNLNAPARFVYPSPGRTGRVGARVSF